jgi:xylulokinase
MAAKIKWIKEEFPEEYKRSLKFINLNTYVAGRLAGLSGEEAFIDYSVLAMNGLADVKKGMWNKDIIDDLDLDESKLPRIFPPYRQVGIISKAKFGTKNDIKVLTGIGDQIAGFMGAGILNRRDLIDVAGTYTVLGYASDSFIPYTSGRIISSIYSGIGEIYYHLAVVAMGGYLYSWFTDKFGYNASGLVKPKNTRGLYFIPYIGGRTAPSQLYYHGTFYGIKWNHDLDSFYTSMLECIGYEYDFILEKIKKLNGIKSNKPDKIKVIGGGARNHVWNEIKTNILALEYLVMGETSFEIMGNYLIARYGSKIREGYKSLLDQNIISVSGSIKPVKEKVRYYSIQKEKYRKIVDAIGSIYREFES